MTGGIEKPNFIEISNLPEIYVTRYSERYFYSLTKSNPAG